MKIEIKRLDIEVHIELAEIEAEYLINILGHSEQEGRIATIGFGHDLRHNLEQQLGYHTVYGVD